MSKPDGGPVYPHPALWQAEQPEPPDGPVNVHYVFAQRGQTLRAWFAGMAMQAILASETQGDRPQQCGIRRPQRWYAYGMCPTCEVGETGIEAVARGAVAYADALIAELEK